MLHNIIDYSAQHTDALILSFGALLFLAYYLRYRVDVSLIRADLARRDAKAQRITWSPFGPGWFGNGRQRIYFVRYEDKYGNVAEKYCQTSMFGSVYWRDA